jgi:hypothetical protein
MQGAQVSSGQTCLRVAFLWVTPVVGVWTWPTFLLLFSACIHADLWYLLLFIPLCQPQFLNSVFSDFCNCVTSITNTTKCYIHKLCFLGHTIFADVTMWYGSGIWNIIRLTIWITKLFFKKNSNNVSFTFLLF